MSTTTLLHSRNAAATVSWDDALALVYSEAQVVALAREYLRMLGPDELQRLPEGCRPPQDLGAAEIADYAYELARHRFAAPPDDATQQLSTFFSNAASRLARINARYPEYRRGAE